MTVKTAIRRTRVKRSKKAASQHRMRLALDADCRAKVFERDGFQCVRCGKPNPQWCHVFSRRHPCLRWEPDNSFAGCAGCHMFWHHEPLLAVDWFRKSYPLRYERLMAVMQVNPKVRVKELYAEMKRGESKSCSCQIPNAGLPLTGLNVCQVCGLEV